MMLMMGRLPSRGCACGVRCVRPSSIKVPLVGHVLFALVNDVGVGEVVGPWFRSRNADCVREVLAQRASRPRVSEARGMYGGCMLVDNAVNHAGPAPDFSEDYAVVGIHIPSPASKARLPVSPRYLRPWTRGREHLSS